MKFKKAKQIVIKDFQKNLNCFINFGWKFRIYPKLRKQMKHWAKEMLENEI